VKQWCVHRTATFQELADLLSTYDMKRDLLELNFKAGHAEQLESLYMEPPTGKNYEVVTYSTCVTCASVFSRMSFLSASVHGEKQTHERF
jgi:hypothetical protein